MTAQGRKPPSYCSVLLVFFCVPTLLLFGCSSTHQTTKVCSPQYIPREMSMSALETYRIGTSDILTVEVLHLVPKSPYLLKTFDTISIVCSGVDPSDSINGLYRIQPGGTLQLPAPYGAVQVSNMTCEEIGRVLTEKVQGPLKEEFRQYVSVSVSLNSVSGLQPVGDTHMVAADGCINLGSYGSVDVRGLTIPEATEMIEFQLAEYLENPKVAVDVYAYNSKKYYVILQGAGFGDKPASFPYTGNETVLDAIANVNGLDRVSSKRIWIARPGADYMQGTKLDVDWNAITAGASWQTNYQILPNDRIYIAEDKMVAFDTNLSKVIAPFERMMGFTMLGAQTATRLSGPVLRGGGDPQR